MYTLMKIGWCGHLLSLTLAAKSHINVSNSIVCTADRMISALTKAVTDDDDNDDDITFGS